MSNDDTGTEVIVTLILLVVLALIVGGPLSCYHFREQSHEHMMKELELNRKCPPGVEREETTK